MKQKSLLGQANVSSTVRHLVPVDHSTLNVFIFTGSLVYNNVQRPEGTEEIYTTFLLREQTL